MMNESLFDTTVEKIIPYKHVVQWNLNHFGINQPFRMSTSQVELFDLYVQGAERFSLPWIDINTWCKENCEGRFALVQTVDSVIDERAKTNNYFYENEVCFDLEEDAMLFKMVWG